jgi:diketogulonate reductase-like aldo/keto reductase
MRRRPLGPTGESVPEIGIGTYRYESGPAPIRRAIELGACLVDTAELYGNESLVGEAIRARRHEVVVATKLRALRPDEVTRSADESLGRLRCGVIDLYQLHFPDARVPIADTMGAMARLVEAGKIRFIGVSNFSVSELRAARAACPYPIVSNQVPYSLIDRTIEVELLPYCRANDITVIAYSPLAQGLARLADADPEGALGAVARRHGRTVAQVALAWCLGRPGVVVIPKGGSVAHVEENCGASGLTLDDQDLAALDRVEFTRRGRVYTTARRFVRRWRQRLGLAR